MPFGTRSHWIQPWRAYLDTPTAQTLKDAIGINFNVSAGDAAATARLLAASGFHEARLEIGWGELDYDHPDQLRNPQDWLTKLTALRDAGLRPLILLNSNEGRPAPAKDLSLTITQPVAPGSRTIQLDPASAAAVVPGRTGVNATKAADFLITSVTPDGVATLSQPVPIAVPAGAYPGMTLRYEPFSPLTNPDGSPSARGQATMDGWLDYVRTVTEDVKAVLGSSDFDVEVFNEHTFGSAFFDINDYYTPSIASGTVSDDQILRRTADLIKDPANGLGGVRVGDGFTNQEPWDSGATLPANVDAMDKHLYPRYLQFPGTSMANTPLGSDGQPSGTSGNDAFTPFYATFFPEYYLTGIQTESLVRDIAPITTQMPGGPLGGTVDHGRATSAPGGTPPQVWMTEMGLESGYANDRGAGMDQAEVDHLRAKAALRTLTSFVNKGVGQVDLFAAGGSDWGLVGNAFFSALHAGTDPGTTGGGPTMDAVRRMVGALGSDVVHTRRSLSLASVGDYAGGVQFDGDGTAAHPALHDRDVLAFLPFQASDDRFVIPVYVMTRNLAKVYDTDAPASDVTRRDLPAERYQLTIGGTHAATARVSATDPLTGDSVPVQVVRRTAEGWLVVELPVTDSPRLLTIDDGADATS